MIDFLQAYETLIELILIFVSVTIAVVAVIVSITTSRRQNKIALFNERYEVASLYIKLFDYFEMISASYLTSKGKVIFWNSLMFSPNSEIMELGTKILTLDMELEKIERDSEEYLEKIELRNKYINEKYILDYLKMKNDSIILEKGRILFQKNIAIELAKMIGFYELLVSVMDNPNTNEIYEFPKMDSLIEGISKYCINVKKEKIIDKMDAYFNFTKKK